jgi:hypothetical protein
MRWTETIAQNDSDEAEFDRMTALAAGDKSQDAAGGPPSHPGATA